jgi:deoxyribonuclease II
MIWLFSLLCPALAAALQCISDTGQPIDSWFIIKAPNSTRYLYADPETPFQPSIHSSLNLTSDGALAKTTKQLWNQDGSYFIYNDEDPNSSTYSYTYGHLKGYAAIDETDDSAIWVQHSIPKFLEGPSTRDSYGGLLQNAWDNSQHILCLSITGSTLESFAPSLFLTRARIYDHSISSTVSKQYPNLTALFNGYYSREPICTQQTFQTVGGMIFNTFEKSTQWNSALWDNCVAPFYQTGLIVQSWLQGSRMGANCSGSVSIQDITSVWFSQEFSWKNPNDHSKWAVSQSKQVVCMGDINRVYAQAMRGGGAVCLSEPNYVQALVTAHIQTDAC